MDVIFSLIGIPFCACVDMMGVAGEDDGRLGPEHFPALTKDTIVSGYAGPFVSYNKTQMASIVRATIARYTNIAVKYIPRVVTTRTGQEFVSVSP